MLRRLREGKRFLERQELLGQDAAPRARASVARRAVIASWDPESGKFSPDLDFVIAAALITELTSMGRLGVSGSGKTLEVSVRDSAPLGDHDLDDALSRIGSGVFGRKLTRVRRILPNAVEVIHGLVVQGLVQEEQRTRMGVFPVRRFRPTPAAGHEQLVGQLRRVLRGEESPDEDTARLVAAMSLGVPVKLLVGKADVREARARAESVAERLPSDEQEVLATLRDRWINSDSGYSG